MHVNCSAPLVYSGWVIELGYDFQVIGQRIRRARELKGMTQDMLAKAMTVSNAYISKIERGKTPINLDNLGKICEALDTSAEFILTGTSTASMNYMHNEIMEMLEGCSPDKIKLIAQVIRPIVGFNGQLD